MNKQKINHHKVLLISAIVTVSLAALSGIAYTWLSFDSLSNSNQKLEKRLGILEKVIEITTENLVEANGENELLKKANNDLLSSLQAEKGRNTEFQNQFNQLSGTVGNLKKLSETDKELLMLYSKVYFLNENYVPSDLAQINSSWSYNPSKTIQFHTKALPFLENMLNAAKSDGVELRIVSAYRSFDEQIAVKTGYKVIYGSGANQFSADQGYSEHQLGTAVDISTDQSSSLTTSFEKTKAFEWLRNNAHKYGFILSYPKGNSYYQYEPWHWRFVGTILANDLKNLGINFYDMPQRTANSYLLKIFD